MKMNLIHNSQTMTFKIDPGFLSRELDFISNVGITQT